MFLLCSNFCKSPQPPCPREQKEKKVTDPLDSVPHSYYFEPVLLYISNRTHGYSRAFRNGLENGRLADVPIKATLRHKKSPGKTEFRNKGLVTYLSQRMRDLTNHLVQCHVFTHKETITQCGKLFVHQLKAN